MYKGEGRNENDQNQDDYIANHDDANTADEAYEALYNARVERYKNMNEYFMEDDWTIPELGKDGMYNRWLSQGFVLKNGSILPDIRTAEGQVAAKQEMLAGRAVAVAYMADQSMPDQGKCSRSLRYSQREKESGRWMQMNLQRAWSLTRISCWR